MAKYVYEYRFSPKDDWKEGEAYTYKTDALARLKRERRSNRHFVSTGYGHMQTRVRIDYGR
jgi:hypothetical protein